MRAEQNTLHFLLRVCNLNKLQVVKNKSVKDFISSVHHRLLAGGSKVPSVDSKLQNPSKYDTLEDDYSTLVDDYMEWRGRNHLLLNLANIQEIKRIFVQPQCILGEDVSMVEDCR